ncbi:DNA-repair protein rad2, partial [Protomyces lactucae-debilis]
MGIKGLTQVISENAPAAMKNLEIKSFFGRKVAIDASMSLYQFLIAVRQNDGQQLQSESGETTSHLLGMFYRTIRIVDNGIKPVYVFDGAPPKLKSGELAKRIARNAQASKDAAEAKETGTVEEVDKFSRRTVRVTRQHNEEAKLLLKLMGIPFVEAPCEAEACCAQLAKSEKVFAAASEDMDTLCFDAPVLLRHLTFSEARKEPISEITTSKVLTGLGLTRDQFIDMCILLGCDYCDAIRGIGPKKALELIKEHGDIEHILESLKGNKKFEVPETWPYKDARELFKNPDIPRIKTSIADLTLEWNEPDVDALIAFLCDDKGFDVQRVRNGADKLRKATKQKQQGRLDSFFKPIPGATTTKRKAPEKSTKKKPATKKTKQ